jgi:hypothetical protein
MAEEQRGVLTQAGAAFNVKRATQQQVIGRHHGLDQHAAHAT